MSNMKESENCTSECSIDSYGTKYWFLNGEHHRENGPAIEHASIGI